MSDKVDIEDVTAQLKCAYDKCKGKVTCFCAHHEVYLCDDCSGVSHLECNCSEIGSIRRIANKFKLAKFKVEEFQTYAIKHGFDLEIPNIKAELAKELSDLGKLEKQFKDALRGKRYQQLKGFEKRLKKLMTNFRKSKTYRSYCMVKEEKHLRAKLKGEDLEGKLQKEYAVELAKEKEELQSAKERQVQQETRKLREESKKKLEEETEKLSQEYLTKKERL
jgi:ElaB/YqjD/DUF883 family membrane-anchored ribosome-binding protein